MKITIKHWTTEIEISDENIKDDGRGLIYHNQEYTLKLLKEAVNQVINLQIT